MKNNKMLDRYYWRVRTHKLLKRLLKKRKRKKRRLSDTRFILSREVHLDYFAQTVFLPRLTDKIRKKSCLEVKIPSVFSIYDNPKKVLSIIATISRMNERKSIKSLYIDHSKCRSNGLGAEILLASAASCLDKVKSAKGTRFDVRGTYPDDEAISRMINSIGIVKEVNGRPRGLENIPNDKTLVFRKESIPKEVIDPSGGDKKNSVARSFIEYFDRCLDKADRRLSKTGKQRLNEYTGEILDNAGRHSKTNMWHIYLYLDYTNDETLNVHIVVYSLGNTIYENFLEKKDVDEVWKTQLAKYLELHKGKLPESDLVTVMSMQQSVTSNRDSDKSGGLGTVKFIQFFDEVSKECNINSSCHPKMTIISGETQLKFDASMIMKENDKGVLTIPFNQSGELTEEPDKRYVTNLGGHCFPGVLVEINFPIRVDSELMS
ncbi:hypothetical protein CWC05_18295 [Pseudoalteromonas ruthenica]|uniref:Uncharacterized protein n=1 Tax=Pseudoalteromonas ruthenica TaxID=151081 RepID=A0A5S3YZN6_9GAMM|nr:hypothetical protein [Pseudoalteromonas ruthenica]TMP85492.1 hypothetical protein CWC05_18295 [Pseudoalteromonas ruthenica]